MLAQGAGIPGNSWIQFMKELYGETLSHTGNANHPRYINGLFGVLPKVICNAFYDECTETRAISELVQNVVWVEITIEVVFLKNVSYVINESTFGLK